MIFYVAVATTLACPGGWLSGAWPQALRPLICKSQIAVLVTERLSAATQHGGLVLRCQGLRCREMQARTIYE